MHVTRGALWSAAEPVTARADRRALAERSGAIAVDMEAAAVAGVAARANLPFAAVKAICDPLERELPVAAIRAFAGTNGALEPHLLPRLLLGGPALWLDLARLARDFAAARRALAAAANIALHDRIAAWTGRFWSAAPTVSSVRPSCARCGGTVTRCARWCGLAAISQISTGSMSRSCTATCSIPLRCNARCRVARGCSTWPPITACGRVTRARSAGPTCAAPTTSCSRARARA